MSISCFVLAGEKSGENHMMSFLPDLIRKFPSINFYGVGGDEMQSLGVELLYHLNEFSSWGLTEVVKKLPFYYKALKNIQQTIQKRKTQVAILVDFQEANYYLARKLFHQGVKVLYYVAPQAWGWRSYRAQGLAKHTYRLYTILPFEKKWFLDRGVKQVLSIAHPLGTHYKNNPPIPAKMWNEYINILLLPGSRNSEVQSLLPTFIDTIIELKKRYPQKLKIYIVQTNSVRKGLYEKYNKYFDKVFNSSQLSTALSDAHLCLASSGTVTLETSIYQLPTIVCYKANLFTAFVFYNFIRYNSYISLTNLILSQKILPEYLQDEVNEFNLIKKLSNWIDNPDEVKKMKHKLSLVLNLLQGEYSTPIESIEGVFHELISSEYTK